MIGKASITLLEGKNGFKISGEIKLETLPNLAKQLLELEQPNNWLVDCKDITYANSALIALLLKLNKKALDCSNQLELVSLPQAILPVIKAYGLEPILAYN